MTRRQRLNQQAADAVIVNVPLTFRKRGGRKQMIMPHGSYAPTRVPSAAPSTSSNATIVRALARAHRWKDMLESGSFDSITELAKAEGVNRSYLCRMLRLTLLSPELTNAILEGRFATRSLDQLMQPFAVKWDQQEPAVL